MIARRIARARARIRRRARIAGDFLAYEAPRLSRIARRPFRAELGRWSTPATALALVLLSAPKEPFA